MRARAACSRTKTATITANISDLGYMAYGHCPYDVGRRSREVINVSRQSHPHWSDTCPARSATLFSRSPLSPPQRARARLPSRPRPRSALRSPRTRRSRASRWTLSILRCKRERLGDWLRLERFERLNDAQRIVAQRSRRRSRYALGCIGRIRGQDDFEVSVLARERASTKAILLRARLLSDDAIGVVHRPEQ